VHDFPAPDVVLPHRVSYGETDAMGVLYYAEYLHLFERARSAYIRHFGVSYADIERRGLFLPVREAQCRYRVPARYDDLVFVRVAVSEWGRASLRFVYEMLAENKKTLLAQGMTQHALVNGDGRPVGVPGWFRDLFLDPEGNPRSPAPKT
jgi:acyl-CoA thioester hydrolase